MACAPGDEAITPVVGTLLILAITVVGMVGILAWGAPTIEAIQAQNAQVGIVGEFEDVRSSAIDLSIPDASRIPTINVPRGDLGIEQGTRVMVTANHDALNTGCDLHVTGWDDGSTTTIAVSQAGCRVGATFEVLQVSGSNTVLKTDYVAGTGTSASSDFSQGNWLFRLSNGNALSLVVYTQAFLLDTDQLVWDLATSSGGASVHFDLGAVFSRDGGSYFLEKSPSLQENEFGTDVYSVRLRTLSDAGGISGISGRGSHQVFLGLVGNYARIHEDTYKLRYDFQGELAESWCGALLLRNRSLTTSAYTEDVAYACEQTSAAAIRSVTYQPNLAATAFEFELIHASIRVTLTN